MPTEMFIEGDGSRCTYFSSDLVEKEVSPPPLPIVSGTETAWHTFTGWNSLPTDMVSNGGGPRSARASSNLVWKDVSVVSLSTVSGTSIVTSSSAGGECTLVTGE